MSPTLLFAETSQPRPQILNPPVPGAERGALAVLDSDINNREWRAVKRQAAYLAETSVAGGTCFYLCVHVHITMLSPSCVYQEKSWRDRPYYCIFPPSRVFFFSFFLVGGHPQWY